eukprot:gnl/TRDRNA2_/TRDRNA2_164046_c1_seq2.p2 gnl/TRDRNA2_/TRDRNA2_164046_c1~~gnl/TRDRNA2_/TRDRNA2_164046_c1_seq2.p2  ORF type:complete len:112 (-),score=5.47 gnl/TRDRNA2_/TRDRNA2_164046_c1_seq2:195-530(-)
MTTTGGATTTGGTTTGGTTTGGSTTSGMFLLQQKQSVSYHGDFSEPVLLQSAATRSQDQCGCAMVCARAMPAGAYSFPGQEAMIPGQAWQQVPSAPPTSWVGDLFAREGLR